MEERKPKAEAPDAGVERAPEPTPSRRGLFSPRGLAAAAAASVAAKSVAAQSTGGPAGGVVPLVVVYLRGGIDPLAVLGPYDDVGGWYSALRDKTRMKPPGPNPDDALHLTTAPESFGIPKTCASLLEVWSAGDLGFILQMGLLYGSLSHFAMQDASERGSVDDASTGCKFTVYDGWAARYLQNHPAPCPLAPRAVAVSSTVPTSLQGANGVIATPDLSTFGVMGPTTEPRKTAYENALFGSYGAAGPPLDGAAQTLRDSIAFVQDAVGGYSERMGSNYPGSPFGQGLRNIAALIRADDPDRCPELYHIDHGGHDKHDNENLFATTDGAYGNVLKDLCDGLRAFWYDLTDPQDPRPFLLFCMSEFGRRADENSSAGTDHGQGGLGIAMGQGVDGGKIHGDWRTLDPSELVNGNLAVTVDYRQVLGEILTERFGVSDLSLVFPGCFSYAPIGILT